MEGNWRNEEENPQTQRRRGRDDCAGIFRELEDPTFWGPGDRGRHGRFGSSGETKGLRGWVSRGTARSDVARKGRTEE